MSAARYFFVFFYAIVAMIGLITLGLTHDYLQFFGFTLLLFGCLQVFATVKRHFDETEYH